MSWVTITPPDKNAYICSQNLKSKDSLKRYLWCGNYYCNICFRTFISFDLSNLIGKYDVLAAYLKMFVDKTIFHKSVIANITPYSIMTDWDPETLTWDNQPPYDQLSYGGTAHIAGRGWAVWNITNIVSNWVENGNANYGIMLKSTELRNFESKRFFSGTEPVNVWLRPQLTLAVIPIQNFGTNVNISGRSNYLSKEYYTTTNVEQYSHSINTSESTQITFYIKNKGTNPAVAYIQTSPDNISFSSEPKQYNIMPQQTISLIPYIYGFYTRVAFMSQQIDYPTNIDLWCLTQV